MTNEWQVYSLDDVDDRLVEEYIVDYEIEEDWPEYEIPKDDIVLNKEALLAIKQWTQQQPPSSDERRESDEEILKGVTPAASENETAPLQENKNSINAMHQTKGLNNLVDEEALLSAPLCKFATKVKVQDTMNIREGTMTMLLVTCIIIWLLLQWKVTIILFMWHCLYIYNLV